MKYSVLNALALVTALGASSCRSNPEATGSFSAVSSQFGAPDAANPGVPFSTASGPSPASASMGGSRGLPREAEALAELKRRALELRQERFALRQDDVRVADSAFGSVYAERGRPKMALFANRVLSDSVLEWTVQHGVTFDAEGLPHDYKVSSRNELGGAQQNLQVAWMWSFEDGFTGAMGEAGAQLVDRATVMRLVAANDRGTGESERPLSVRQVELDALRQYAEVLVELLVEPDDEVGFIMRARAIEVPSGVLLATANTIGMRPPETPLPTLHADALRAGPNGYEAVKVSFDPNEYVDPGGPMAPRDAAAVLARNLLDRLATSWAR